MKVVEIDATGLSIRLPYDAPGADPGAGYERVLAAEIAGDFSDHGDTLPLVEALTDAEMSAMTLSEVSFKDLVVDTGTDAEQVVEQLAINMAPDAWTLSIDELRLIAEGQIEHVTGPGRAEGLDETTDGSLQDVEALRLTAQPLLDSVRMTDPVTKVDGPQRGWIRVNPGDGVVDYSALGAGIDGPGIGYEHVIGTDYNDTLISDWSVGHIISGGAGDDHLGSRRGIRINDTFVGGSGADTFHLAIEPT